MGLSRLLAYVLCVLGEGAIPNDRMLSNERATKTRGLVVYLIIRRLLGAFFSSQGFQRLLVYARSSLSLWVSQNLINFR